ncbi:Na+/H+ antiporter subunit E [Arthrobacter roseus]|uniref:Na+/H+ antiporter subunit E n=1 Tax=Arthrobacter roseus TaxID=136274 RepID=UPI001966976E|nr:Na+/H+ antiporter subunit E [Arthrobacter roseus]MBM7849707.1 multicomponent Na+:H+ antiporter subunit E [Arthrobacter roseus]
MRKHAPFVQELPLIVWLVLIWGSLWRDFSGSNLLFGALIAMVVTRFFYLPPVELSGRFNILHAVTFGVRFFGKVVVASLEVFWLAVRRGPHIRNAVVAVQLRSSSDFIVTATGHTLTLIPGSLVVDVDRSTSTLYLHCLNVKTPEEADAIRQDARSVEAQIIRVLGSRDELDRLREERS